MNLNRFTQVHLETIRIAGCGGFFMVENLIRQWLTDLPIRSVADTTPHECELPVLWLFNFEYKVMSPQSVPFPGGSVTHLMHGSGNFPWVNASLCSEWHLDRFNRFRSAQRYAPIDRRTVRLRHLYTVYSNSHRREPLAVTAMQAKTRALTETIFSVVLTYLLESTACFFWPTLYAVQRKCRCRRRLIAEDNKTRVDF